MLLRRLHDALSAISLLRSSHNNGLKSSVTARYSDQRRWFGIIAHDPTSLPTPSGGRVPHRLCAILAVGLLCALAVLPASATTYDCGGGDTLLQSKGGEKVDLKVTGICNVNDKVQQGKTSLIYVFRNVNIINGGVLQFVDGTDVDFYAESILIEYMGALRAGMQTQNGAFQSRLTFHLWGEEDDAGIECQSAPGPNGEPCGIPADLWATNTQLATNMDMDVKMPPMPPKNRPCVPSDVDPKDREKYDKLLPGNDCFYQYEILDDADRHNNLKAYFGHKVLAVSFGGSLQLFGSKGTTYLTGPCNPKDLANECSPSNTGSSWRRLTAISADKTTLSLSNPKVPVNWKKGDHVVVTTTDYLPLHSEERILAEDATNNQLVLTEPLTYPHNTTTYDLNAKNVPADIGPVQDPSVACSAGQTRCVETRAAVALLTRNIQIVSDGDKPMSGFNSGFYGGHTIVRQGFASYQVQGVEFRELGQGGAIGRYPVHFHMDRRTPQQTDPTQGALNFLKDCSINISMTRWVTLHATQGMYLARNVGWKSIGHGFYLEDATEINNRLFANIGILARAAIKDQNQNPRQVPGILADTKTDGGYADAMPYRSDFNHPTVFWIMNGWNDFQYNMAAGASTCGACYWWMPSANSGPSQYEHWDGYASQQIWGPVTDPNNPASKFGNLARAGLTPMKTFIGNSCVAAMSSFQTVGATTPCLGVPAQGTGGLAAVSSEAPQAPGDPNAFNIYYPTITAQRNPSVCPGADDPSKPVQCGDTPGVHVAPCSNSSAINCAVTVLDHYTSSFNWAQTNFSAVWLRPKWFLVSNSAITDVQTGGINFVTGGGYTRSDLPVGYWSLLHKSVLIGHTQPPTGNPFALDSGPFNPETRKAPWNLKCDTLDPDRCESAAEGVTFLLPPFPGQRLFNIYDGPAFEDYNAYLDTTTTAISDCSKESNGNCKASEFPAARNLGVLLDKTSTECYLPNAAIAWKQPNGFYYPPSFYSKRLWFQNVDIRHFVVEPFFKYDERFPNDPFVQDQSEIVDRYCTYNAPDRYGNGTSFTGFNHIDRETVLNDFDGSLTGLLALDPTDPAHNIKPTISINEDPFFNSQIITPECLSDKGVQPWNRANRVFTASASPYEWLSTAMVADCAIQKGPYNNLLQCQDGENRVRWANACTDPSCRGVPLYREDLTATEMKDGDQPQIRMMGQSTGQRSTLSLNHGSYYIDTTQSCSSQTESGSEAPSECPVCTPNPQGTDCRYCQPGKDCWTNPVDENLTPWHPTVFIGGHTYYVFFIYAKPTTKQTYDIYIGKKEQNAYKVTPIVADLPSQAYSFTDVPDGSWIKNPPDYDPETGILTVNVDLSKEEAAFTQSKSWFCQPRSFCEVRGSGATASCGCKPGTQCTDDSVCTWAQQDIDCPVDPTNPAKMRCYGFSFTMPTNFMPPSQPMPPPSDLFKLFTDNDYFNEVGFTGQGVQPSGGCIYTAK